MSPLLLPDLVLEETSVRQRDLPRGYIWLVWNHTLESSMVFSPFILHVLIISQHRLCGNRQSPNLSGLIQERCISCCCYMFTWG